MSAALRHFVEEALGTRLPNFADWFPQVFDWERMAADAPRMVAAATGELVDADDADNAARLERGAGDRFKCAHTAGLAVLVARADTDLDPQSRLERLTEEADDEEEARFAELASQALGEVEAYVANPDHGPGDEEALGPDAAALALLYELAWPDVDDLLGGTTLAEDPEADPTSLEAMSQPVFDGFARLGVLMAAARWLAEGFDVPSLDDE